MNTFTKDSADILHSTQTADRKRIARWLCEHDIVLEQSFAGRLRALEASHKKTAAS